MAHFDLSTMFEFDFVLVAVHLNSLFTFIHIGFFNPKVIVVVGSDLETSCALFEFMVDICLCCLLISLPDIGT